MKRVVIGGSSTCLRDSMYCSEIQFLSSQIFPSPKRRTARQNLHSQTIFSSVRANSSLYQTTRPLLALELPRGFRALHTIFRKYELMFCNCTYKNQILLNLINIDGLLHENSTELWLDTYIFQLRVTIGTLHCSLAVSAMANFLRFCVQWRGRGNYTCIVLFGIGGCKLTCDNERKEVVVIKVVSWLLHDTSMSMKRDRFVRRWLTHREWLIRGRMWRSKSL